MKNILVIFVLSLLIISCGRQTKKEENACSCDHYFAAQPRPTWVDTEGLRNQVYYSQGIAQCTGLKTIDVKEASVNARGNLSRMLETQVQTEILLIREGNTATRSGSESGKLTTSITSDALLSNSSIYAHWMDPNSCTVYSAVKLAKADIDQALKEAKQKEQNKLKNQRFVVISEGDYEDTLKVALTQVLSDNGVRQISDNVNEADYRFRVTLNSVDIFKDKKLVRVSLFARIVSLDGQTVWSASLRGKSISLQQFQEDYQIREALINSFKQNKLSIQTALDQPISPQSTSP